MTVDPRVYSICAEYGIKIVDAHRYPDIGETRAVATLDRILRNYGEGHFRLVMTTLAETSNNRAYLDEYMVDDLGYGYCQPWPDRARSVRMA